MPSVIGGADRSSRANIRAFRRSAGQVEVVGDGPYDLDRDGDGVACDDTAASYSDEDTYAPKTEYFGSANGSVGSCADGTRSESIGRPGACSHHGGVGWRASSSAADLASGSRRHVEIADGCARGR